ncbi:hypothetical protein [Microbispora sp. NPDC049125]|uniref:hypothetical protein n=1 Tax=Microbispora sp. NPDC049125 TaxID=3154929 RepID=UPI00346633C9
MAHERIDQGAPHEAARWASVPVINCGDGWGEHPTQVMIDLYTIWKEFGKLEGVHIVCTGDMRMRTMRSLAFAATLFPMKITWVTRPEMAPAESFCREIRAAGAEFVQADSIESVIGTADVVYMEALRQPDHGASSSTRAAGADATPPEYRLTLDLLREKAKPDLIVLHSLPHLDELSEEIDDTPYARYWVEGFNGVVVRMGLLALIMGAR